MDESDDCVMSVLVVLISVPLPLASPFHAVEGKADGGGLGEKGARRGVSGDINPAWPFPLGSQLELEAEGIIGAEG